MENKKTYPLFLFLAILIICKITYWLFTFPNADEAYYWLWGQFPALSYHDHPSLQALIQNISHKLFGNSIFALRLPVILSFIICIYFYYKILKKLSYSDNIPMVLLIFFSIPLFFLFTTYAWHDYIMITMCLISGYFWLNLLTDVWENKKGKTHHIFLAFIFIGLAALSKYNSVFIAIGIGLVIIMNKPLRSILLDFRIYLGLILCIVIISPIFIWNIQNEYGSFEFTLGQRTISPLLKGEFFDGNFIGFVFGSFLLIPPSIWWVVFKSKLFSQKQNTTELSSYKIIYHKIAISIFLCSTVTFLILSNFSMVLYYWNIQAYIFILPLAIIYLLKSNRKLVYFTLIYSALANILFVIHFSILPLTSFFEGARDNDGALHYGWETIGDKMDSIVAQSPEKVQILTSTYRTASLLSFQLDRKDIYSYSHRFDQFDYWTNNLKYQNKKAIILTDDWKRINHELYLLLDDIKISDTIHISKYGIKIKDYYIYDAIIKDEYLKK